MNDSDAAPAAPSEPPAAHPPSATESPAPAAVTGGERRLRVWPGVAIVVLYWVATLAPILIAPGSMAHIMISMWAPMLGTALFVVWWLFASRLPWKERFLVLGACVAIAIGALKTYDSSMLGMGGMMVMLTIFPLLISIWIVWLLATLVLRWPFRRNGLIFLFVLIWGYFSLVRLDGVDGTFSSTMKFRWDPTAEQLFLQQARGAAPVVEDQDTDELLTAGPGDWPGFRGADRTGSRSGVKIVKDWSAHPPREVWRHRVGPGWSSFAVIGTRAYTQEQRGEDEVTVCYDAATGQELWEHRDAARFTEAIAGPGPRATPTFHEGRLYVQGATGRLHCLNARTGISIWTRDIVADSGATVPTWGYAGSPQVAAGVVSVFAGGPDGKSVLGYSAETGEPVWSAGEGKFSYCSTQLSRVAGVDQLLICTDAGLAAYEPAKGTVLWKYDWPLEGGMARVVQPAVVAGTDVLIGTGFGNGTRRVRVTRDGDKWSVEQVWWTKAFKPYFNDLVVHRNHVFGFDGNFFVCVNLDDGKIKWKARGYGNGEVLLLPDQNLLLVVTEATGELVLVDATPDRHVELFKIPALNGKTWNHPVVAHGKLFLRNGEEAVCYDLGEPESSGAESEDRGPSSD